MNASERYNQTSKDQREAAKSGDATAQEKAGRRLRDQALERANRREWAHKRRGSEDRWSE